MFCVNLCNTETKSEIEEITKNLLKLCMVYLYLNRWRLIPQKNKKQIMNQLIGISMTFQTSLVSSVAQLVAFSERSYQSVFSHDLPLFPSPVPRQFGDSQQLRLVRILRSTVMVRVGGGWMALDEFLVKNDPCRGEFKSSPQEGTRQGR